MNNKLNGLTEYFVKGNHIDQNLDYEITCIPAKQLICANRFDLMAKWIYIDAYERGIDLTFAKRVYRDNINSFSWGSFTEPGTESKNTFEAYIEQFNELIESIRNNGFDEKQSTVPVGKSDVLLDGAHRVAIAAYFDKEITIIRFPNLSRTFNYSFFRRYLMSDINMGYMANQYAHIKLHCFFACIWPIAGKSKFNEIKEIIQSVGDIVYEQDVYLTYRGMCNFMAQIYGHQAWTGNIDNHFEGVKGKASCCYDKKNPVHTYLFSSDSLDAVLELKKKIRELFTLENHSIHVSDNQYETIMMTELLYNPNSVAVLNNADIFKYSMVFNEMNLLKKDIDKKGLNIERFIIDSSSVLEVCGLRKARDVDYLTDYESDTEIINSVNLGAVDNHISQMSYHSISISDMLYNPENSFYFNGMKFLSIERLIEMKNRRNEPKDRVDVRMLKRFKKSFDNVPIPYRYSAITEINEKLIKYNMYGFGEDDYHLRRKRITIYEIKLKMKFLKKPYHVIKRLI